jgi:hypothetical protein
MRTAPVLKFSWMLLGGSLAHLLARRALARILRRQRLSRVHVGRPSGDGSGARVSGRLLHENPKIGLAEGKKNKGTRLKAKSGKGKGFMQMLQRQRQRPSVYIAQGARAPPRIDAQTTLYNLFNQLYIIQHIAGGGLGEWRVARTRKAGTRPGAAARSRDGRIVMATIARAFLAAPQILTGMPMLCLRLPADKLLTKFADCSEVLPCARPLPLSQCCCAGHPQPPQAGQGATDAYKHGPSIPRMSGRGRLVMPS